MDDTNRPNGLLSFLSDHERPQGPKPNLHHNVIQRSYWESGVATPPMPHKRKKTKKEKKSKKVISAPLNVRHVGMSDIVDQLQNQSKFPVEHIATMSKGEQLASLSPNASLRHVRALLQQGDSWTREVLLCVTRNTLTVKDGVTKISMLEIPLANIMKCQCLGDAEGSVLMVTVDDKMNSTESCVHFFHCTKTPAEVICKEIDFAKLNVAESKDIGRQRRVGVSGQQTTEILQNNWILQAPSPPHTAPPPIPSPPPSTPARPNQNSTIQESLPPPQPPSSSSYDPLQQAHGDQLRAVPQDSSSPVVVHYNEDSASIGSAGTPSQRQIAKHIVRTTSNKHISQSRSQGEGGESSEIRRTMKASRIQRDVVSMSLQDILNHVIEDLDEFIRLLKSKAAAWNELEKKKKKSKRKKHDAALAALRAKAEPPSEDEFKETYKKCKFALNLIAKLGHHLSAPSASELQTGIFSKISQLVSINKGPQLASSVVSPLLNQHTIDLLERKLPQAECNIWRQLGANWFLTIEKWPQQAAPPPDYQIKFSDGCIPPNLHNASDCPANFPTLDTLPRERRESNLEYSDAYDMANQPEAESGLLINPAVKAAVESQFAVVPTIPDFVQKKGLSKAQSQHSLASQGSQGDPPRFARALFDYSASTSQELNIHRGEQVEIIDDSRKWWKVKNYHGQVGYLAGNQLELILPKKKNEIREGTEMIDVHGRRVPAPPKLNPPPVPSPSSRRPSISAAKYSPQSGHHGRKMSLQSHLSPLVEVSESRSSTVSRPQHPPLAPPPSFSPALPHQNRTANGVYVSPPPPPPPPPPPVMPQKPPMSLQEILAQHKVKSKQEGKTRKTSVMQKVKDDNQFDITEALKARKPLRKTTKASLMGGGDENGGINLQQQLKNKVKGKKPGNVVQEEPDIEYQVLPWRANKQAIKSWLLNQGYGDCAEKLTEHVKEGSQLYCMDRETLREMFGSSDGVRLYSQLQKDKPSSEKEAGVAKETEFQKMMRIRKTTLDVAGTGGETTILKLRKPPQYFEERETVLAETCFSRGKGSTRRKTDTQAEHRDTQHYRGDDSTPRRRGANGYDSWSLHKGRKLSKNYHRVSRGEKWDGGHSRRASRYSNTYSDDEDVRRNRSGKLQRSSHYSESQSDSDSHRKRKPNERKERKGSRRRRKPTNIDDFDENSSSIGDSDSESLYSSEYSVSESDSEQGRHLRSSASVSAIPNATWALQGQDQEGEASESRIKAQEVEIKKLLHALGDLQKKSGVKHLPPEKQKELQKGLQNLEHLQTCRKEKPRNAGILAQLIGEQMLLCDHLRDAINHVKVKGLGFSTSSGSLQFQQQQYLQAAAQQQVLAQQQQQLLLEAEQQKQQQQLLLAAAEQQRQLQLAQMVSQQQQLLGLQSPSYGVQGMGNMYNPSYSGLTYF